MPRHPDLQGEYLRLWHEKQQLAEHARLHQGAADGPSHYAVSRARQLLGELAKRRVEGINLYQPIPVQESFHRSMAKERIVRGSNRGAKTTAAAAELAWAALGRHPYADYPKKDGVAMVVGYDLGHIGRVIYPKLFKAGAIRMIRDQDTHEWRAFRPWEDSDKAREKEARPAPPFIPRRFIKTIAWKDKKLNVPAKVELITGWQIFFYSSESEPTQGDVYDLAWFDEEIERDDWYIQVARGLTDRGGRFMWSATPHVGGKTLIDLHERADKQRGNDNPSVDEFLLTLDNNPHIRTADKDLLKEKFQNNAEAYRVLILGEYAAHGLLVYPEFSRHTHCINLTDLPDNKIPANWARWLVVDPGRQVCAGLFVAVPPATEGDFVVFYDEFYIQLCDANKFGEMVEVKTRDQSFECCIIDTHGSNKHEIGTGLNIEEQYHQALKTRNVWERFRIKSFVPGDDNRDSGVETARSWLIERRDNKPYLRIVESKLHNFLYEIEHWHYKRVKTPQGRVVTDTPEDKRRHQMDNFRYIAMFGPKYRKPKPPPVAEGSVSKWLKQKNRLFKSRRNETESVVFGPASAKSRRS